MLATHSLDHNSVTHGEELRPLIGLEYPIGVRRSWRATNNITIRKRSRTLLVNVPRERKLVDIHTVSQDEKPITQRENTVTTSPLASVTSHHAQIIQIVLK
ncbi:hypothetical protein F2P81_010834 [Scophthalmus maximus]|uniref:Uncharacterized protein n=1 Tax=Scophthalmus maximus TaxID=52904 RepID=A0A6A4T1P9_SCOMX|nr:hypothetical protein F2P81_010834 [Scophthalmus maximus]